MKTSVVPVDPAKIGRLSATSSTPDVLDELKLDLDTTTSDAQSLQTAARLLQQSDVPVAFPTETVYGLGADATRSSAVRGIYTAKQRPSDNPLIVHFASLQQIRQILRPSGITDSQDVDKDPIPDIYHPLIRRFWPGPLTILLPNPSESTLAPEVTAGLSTFGARLPRHPIALALIQFAGVPVAAPSANASTKPSPTAAEHVAYDLDGRIEMILDSGPCEVGVESTVVDGLSQPPLILRPGGISLEQIRACPGWENVSIGYKDTSEQGSKPRAPGMKYRHYSPRSPVILVEPETRPPLLEDLRTYLGDNGKIGLVRTSNWSLQPGSREWLVRRGQQSPSLSNDLRATEASGLGFAGMLKNLGKERSKLELVKQTAGGDYAIEVLDMHLGADAADVARGIFAALRRLDQEDVAVILVEGIGEDGDDLAAAVMNRLRKAAEVVK